MGPVPNCKPEAVTELKANVDAAQKKINQAAQDYPNDYAANRDSLQRDVDMLNQNIRAYNHECSTSIPEITLPR